MNTLRVLAIDYKLQDAEVVRYMLTAAERTLFSLSVSLGYAKGLTLLRKQPFDAVLLDVRFAGRGGSSLRELREQFPRLPVILLAHAHDEEFIHETLPAGSPDYLIRERITPDLLARAIIHAVERSRLARENAGLLQDVERLKREMRQMANHDPATGLPNRRLFLERLAVERERADRRAKKLAVLFLHLDRIREIREGIGSEPCILLLRQAASRLASLLRKSDMIAQIEDDLFAMLLPDIARPDDVARIAQAIGDAFRDPFLVREHEVRSATSIGISIYPDDSRETDALLKNADAAWRRASGLGGGNHQFFDPSTNRKAIERRELEDHLRRSVQAGELAIYYQPLIDVSTRQIVCAEALARWHHPEKGFLSPADFIPAAEESGLITAIDEWVLRAVLEQARSWLDAGLHPVCVTMNLSERQLHDPGLIGTLSSVLRETGVPADCLSFEIPEKTAMNDVERTAVRFRELADLGVHISIDDFGTGYSSVHHLERLPVERLKIDKSFIDGVPADPDHRTIVRSVTSLAHNMRMKVVAEGVETEDQLTFVRTTGCDEMQGYLFSRPLPAEAFGELLQSGGKILR